MENKILGGLKQIGYGGPLLEGEKLKIAVKEGTKSMEYAKLITFLTNELRTLLHIDEEVNLPTNQEDVSAFNMEISSFLKELNCSYRQLTQGHMSDRLQKYEDRLLLLDYLCTELMAARILQELKPDKKIELKLQETDEAACLRNILITLRFPKPPPNITIQQLFSKLCPTLQTAIGKVGSDAIKKPAFNGFLSGQQWNILGDIQKDLNDEYKVRREMLLTRLDVTLQSFQWSDSSKSKGDLFEKVYTEKRKSLKSCPDVQLHDVLAARHEVAIIEKTSSSSVRKNTQSSLNKVIIGQVPDRGGRTSEQEPPPPEMPSWQQRSAGPMGRGQSHGNTQNYSRGGRGNYGGSYSNNQSGYNAGYSNSNYGQSRPFESPTTQSTFSSGYSNSSYSSSNNQSGYSSGYGSNYSQNRPFDSAGSYESRNFLRNSGGSETTDYNNSTRSYTGHSGNYMKDSNYEHSSKRPKTYDSFQSNRTTYADQYVAEERHNQHHDRNYGRGRGSSNYRRGRSNY